jgi:hypothetical protein
LIGGKRKPPEGGCGTLRGMKDPILLGWIGALCVLWLIDWLRGRK